MCALIDSEPGFQVPLREFFFKWHKIIKLAHLPWLALPCLPGGQERGWIELLPFRLKIGRPRRGDLALAEQQVAQHRLTPLPESRVQAERCENCSRNNGPKWL